MDRRPLTDHEAELIRANPNLGWDADTMTEAMEFERQFDRSRRLHDHILRQYRFTIALFVTVLTAAAVVAVCLAYLVARFALGV